MLTTLLLAKRCLEEKKIKIEKNDQDDDDDVDNPEEIEINDSDDEEKKKPKVKDEEAEDEEEDNDLEDYDPIHDPNLDDFDAAEIQEGRQRAAHDTYWFFFYICNSLPTLL